MNNGNNSNIYIIAMIVMVVMIAIMVIMIMSYSYLARDGWYKPSPNFGYHAKMQ